LYKRYRLQAGEQEKASVLEASSSYVVIILLYQSKIDELEKHVQHLRSVLNQNHPTATPVNTIIGVPPYPQVALPPRSLPQTTTFNSAVDTGSVSTGTYTHTSNAGDLTNDSPHPYSQSPATIRQGHSIPGYSRPGALRSRAIESTALGKEQIDTLFQIYFQHFHQFLPILDPLETPDEYYNSSPVLFWVLISVAARRFTEDQILISSLAQAVPKLVWERIAEHPIPFPALQALLVLCMWPFPLTHMWGDASVSLSNISLVAAFHMGLHRPDHMQEFSRNPRTKNPLIPASTDPLERRKTWAAVNIVTE
jgi:hypothetical protein